MKKTTNDNRKYEPETRSIPQEAQPPQQPERRYITIVACRVCPHYLDVCTNGLSAAKCGFCGSPRIISELESESFPFWCPLSVLHDTRTRPHPAPAQGTSKLCFGTQHPASECCQQCNELETCKQKQRYLDYDKKEAARQAREDERQIIVERLECLEGIGSWTMLQQYIDSLRSTRQQAGDQP